MFSLPELHITYSKRAKPFTQRNRKVAEAEMASCTYMREHGQKRVRKSTQIQTKSPIILQNYPSLQIYYHKNILFCLCTSQAHPDLTRNLLSPSVQAAPSVSPPLSHSMARPYGDVTLWHAGTHTHTQAGLNGHRNVRVGVTSALRECLPPRGSFFLLLAHSKALQKAMMSCYTPPACPILHNITASDTKMHVE